jgi:hypothetical protein
MLECGKYPVNGLVVRGERAKYGGTLLRPGPVAIIQE